MITPVAVKVHLWCGFICRPRGSGVKATSYIWVPEHFLESHSLMKKHTGSNFKH